MTDRIHSAAAPLASLASLSLCLGLGACRTPPPITGLDRAPGLAAPVQAERCLRFAGPPGDTDLRGLPRTDPVRCCPSDYGFDPALAQRSCGFTEYLGESEELACVHRFRAADGAVHELRLSPMLDLPFAAALALHEQGRDQGRAQGRDQGRGEAPEGLPSLWWSATQGRRWAYVPGWPVVRRLGWDEAACEPPRMLPVLAAMLEAPPDPGAQVVVPRLLEPAEPLELEALAKHPNLLERELALAHADRRYPLPRAAGELVDALLAAAIAGDQLAFANLIDAGARIGLPDRRQIGARALLGQDGGAAAARLLLAGAARFPADAKLHCPMIDRHLRPRIARGEALMWCLWMSEDGLDALVFGLRGRVVEGPESDGRVAYVGVFPSRPTAALRVVGEPTAPAVVVELGDGP